MNGSRLEPLQPLPGCRSMMNRWRAQVLSRTRGLGHCSAVGDTTDVLFEATEADFNRLVGIPAGRWRWSAWPPSSSAASVARRSRA